jgi:RND family efflux transporter MFP subunit
MAENDTQDDSNDDSQDQDNEQEQQNPQDKEKMKKTTKKVLIILIVIAVILAIWGIASRLIARSHLEKRTVNDSQTTVVTVKPTLSGADDELVLPGSVLAFIEAPIYARTNGYLKIWYTDIGEHVKKGQLLADIETPEVDRQLGQARADLETAHANAVLAKTTNDRWQALVVKQAVSRQDADEKAGAAAAMAAAEASAQQNVERLADLESFKRVLAPFDGVVTARNTDIGALINAGQSAGSELFRVADIHKLRVYAQVPEAFAAAVKSGLRAELHFAEWPGQSFPVESMRTSRALDPTARTLQVELQLDNHTDEFFPGAYTEVHFKLPSSNQTLRVPSNTVLFRADGMQVATVDRMSQQIKMKNIVQGRDFGKTIEILSGIDPSDDIVVNPSDSIEDGLTVRIAPPAKKGSKDPTSDSTGASQKPADPRTKESPL